MKKFKYKNPKFNISSRPRVGLVGGPFHGESIRLTTGSTLEFKVQGYIGFYEHGKWVGN